MTMNKDTMEYYQNPALLLQKLIRFNTTNPPGNEGECVLFLKNLLDAAGIDTRLLESMPGRPNLIARIKGEGNSSPLLLYGHVDVVTVENQRWKHPPFEGVIEDGYVWGRGALDMKGAVAMMAASMLNLKQENITPRGDVIFAVLCDEEALGRHGAGFIVENHAGLLQDVQYAIGEFGAFTMHVGEKKFYPIMIAEKQICTLKATFRGAGGHGSMKVDDSAMAKAGRFITAVQNKKLPVHITEPLRQMAGSMARNLPFPQRAVVAGLLNRSLADIAVKILGKSGNTFYPLLRNTVNATMIHGGNKFNVIPSEVEICLDGRLLPGYGPESVLKELKMLAGEDVILEVTEYSPGPQKIDMGLFKTLEGILREQEPKGIPIPLLIPGVTDARYFSRLGIQTYGFTPMILPKDIHFNEMLHGANERIPVAAVEMGTRAITSLLKKF